MKHRIKVTKFRYGKDANRMLIRKLLRNFVTHGKITTTEKKAKVLRPHIELLVHSAKKNSEASRATLKRKIADTSIESLLVQFVAPAFRDRISGFTTIVHLPNRSSDGASIAKLTWISPVIYKEAEEAKKKPADLKTKAVQKLLKKETKKPIKKVASEKTK